jgi:D-ribose pyranase
MVGEPFGKSRACPLIQINTKERILAMKKQGILNPYLMYGLTSLGHLDSVVICDAGFPVPLSVQCIDLSLVEGIPNFMQVLKAVLNEIIVEEYVIFDFMKDFNKGYYAEVKKMFAKQKPVECSMDEFRKRVEDAKLIIRTGELLPASNIILVSATGVEQFNKELNIECQV